MRIETFPPVPRRKRFSGWVAVSFSKFLGARGSRDQRAGDQTKAVDERRGDEHVLLAGRVGAGGVTEEATAAIEGLEDSGDGRRVGWAHSGIIITCRDRQRDA
jgi:hypothetical protein